MNDRQRDYFRAKLLAWKDEILRESRVTLQTLQEENVNHPDLADRASSETDRAIELRARDRQRKLISKIDAALQRIDDNTYGYCEETGEPISLKRLEARPIATLSVEAQERHGEREKVYREPPAAYSGQPVPRFAAPDLLQVTGRALINGIEDRTRHQRRCTRPSAPSAGLAHQSSRDGKRPARRRDRVNGKSGQDGVAGGRRCRDDGAGGLGSVGVTFA